MKIRIAAASEDEVFVVGIGSIRPNTWVEITDRQALKFLMANGMSIEQSGIEVQVEDIASTRRAEEEE